jgi:hypothetical protein
MAAIAAPNPRAKFVFTGILNDDQARSGDVDRAGQRAVDYFYGRSIVPLFDNSEADPISRRAVASVDAGASLFERLMEKADGRDKLIKAAAGAIEVVSYTIKHSDASDVTKEGFQKLGDSAKTARTIFGLMNIFGGVLTGIKATAIAVYQLVRGLITGDDSKVTVRHQTYDEKVTYRGRKEHLLGLFSMLGQLGGSVCYTIGFGALAPLKCFDNHFKGVLGDRAREAGNKFSFVMMINHICVFIGNIFDAAFAWKKYSESNPGDTIAERQFAARMVNIGASMAEKIFEFVACDLPHVFKANMHPAVRPITSLIYSGISFWRAVHKVETKMEDEVRTKAEQEKCMQIKAELIGQGHALHAYAAAGGQ